MIEGVLDNNASHLLIHNRLTQVHYQVSKTVKSDEECWNGAATLGNLEALI